jgi:lipoyl(octanoyl) transferase
MSDRPHVAGLVARRAETMCGGDSVRSIGTDRRLEVRDLGLVPYAAALLLQEECVRARSAGRAPDTLLLVEHEPIYTLGRNADARHVRASPAELAARGIRVVRTTRGGEVTYHGPGQIVGYPILCLTGNGRGPVWLVTRLEEVLIRTLAAYGVAAATDPVNRGVWIGREKIAAIGVRVTHGVSMHGFSLNVKVRLEDYVGITPCGIEGRGVTSLDRHVAGVAPAAVKTVLIRAFREVFGYD